MAVDKMGVVSRVLFVISLALCLFVAGWYVGSTEGAPHQVLQSVRATVESWKHYMWVAPRQLARQREAARSAEEDDKPRRVELVSASALADPVLLQARQPWEFIDQCPTGCIAVEYVGTGRVARTWPYFLDSIGAADRLVDWPHAHPFGTSFADHADIESAVVYPNGDLLVVFRYGRSHPAGGGAARINPRGGVVWYRGDYSHHQPHIAKNDIALIPSSRYESVGPPHRPPIAAECSSGELKADYIHVVDGSGALLAEVSILDVVSASVWRGALRGTYRPCDPTHINFVHEVGETGAGMGVADIEPGDLVASLRNTASFIVVDRETHKLKHWAQGSWMRQHSVTHLDGSKFIMFDNLGGAHGDESRILTVDLATGVETVVFPTDRTPERFRGLMSYVRGFIDVSPDRQRVLVTYHAIGIGPPPPQCHTDLALEVRISDGEVLAAFCTSFLASYGKAASYGTAARNDTRASP